MLWNPWLITQYGSSRSGLRAPASGPVTKQGYIVKRGRFRKSWLKRWFVLSGTQIEYVCMRHSGFGFVSETSKLLSSLELL